MVTGTQRSEFTYDGFSRRTKIVEKVSGTVTSTKQFVWVGGEIAEERDGNNVVQKKFFGLGEWRNGVGNLVYTFDHLGSLREMTQADGALNGTVRARYEYDPYGRRSANLITGGNALAADLGFTGHYYHANSGLHLAWFRAYDANLGRWISRDPIAETGGLNLYGYVGGDPINSIDPVGLAEDNGGGNVPDLSKYPTMDDAAIAAILSIIAASTMMDVEFAGWIYKNSDGTFSFTKPRMGSKAKSFRGKKPKNGTVCADYHTHGANTGVEGGYEDNDFSKQDMEGNDSEEIVGYLGTANGQVLKYTPKKGEPANRENSTKIYMPGVGKVEPPPPLPPAPE